MAVTIRFQDIKTGKINPIYLYLKELAKGLGVPLTTLLDY